MNNKNIIVGIVSFLAGALSGGLGIYMFKMSKYEKDFKKKQEEMVAYYEKQDNRVVKTPATQNIEPQKPSKAERKDMMEEARKIVAQEGYRKQYGKVVSAEADISVLDDIPAPDDVNNPSPYIIDSTEFGDQEFFEMETWHYYTDGVVTNEENLPVNDEDVEEFVSSKAIVHLRSSSEDTVYVRNERLKTDYEIIEEMRRYADD